ncbi:MAG: hypothetical protein C4557_12360 [Anaerolineaceae bacterium]|jgi:hypothetical protein|nr:MAG: hypothetical protein C4557_12360 [Anaerolineaceae bacterium]
MDFIVPVNIFDNNTYRKYKTALSLRGEAERDLPAPPSLCWYVAMDESPKCGFQFATQNAEKQMEVMDHATHIAPFSPAPVNHPLHF